MDRSKSTLELEDEHDVEISLADSATFALDEQRRRREAEERRQQDIERARQREQEREQQRNSQAAFQPTNPLTLAPDAKGPGGIATGFDGNQAQPDGRLPIRATDLRAGAIETTPVFTTVPRNQQVDQGANAPGGRPGGQTGGQATTATATPQPTTPTNPTALPQGGFSASRLIEQGIQIVEILTGESSDQLAARGRETLKNVQTMFLSPGSDAKDVVLLGQGTDQFEPTTEQQIQLAQGNTPTRFEKLDEVERREFDPHEKIPRDQRIRVNGGPDLRSVRYEYTFDGSEIGGLDDFMANSLSVPNGATIHESVLQSGIPLGFQTADEFRRFRRMLEVGIVAGLNSRIAGFEPEKFKKRKIGIRGSAVSGQKFIRGEGHVGRPFGPKSDLDIFIISPSALDLLRPPDPERPGNTLQSFKVVIRSDEAKLLGLDIVLRNIERFTSREEASIMIFRKGSQSSQKVLRPGKTALPAAATILFE